jgi:hypothetical protein
MQVQAPFIKPIPEKNDPEEWDGMPTYEVAFDFERFMNGGTGEMRNVTPEKEDK